MEEILERLGINMDQGIYSILEELEAKQLDVLTKLDVIQSRAGESNQNEELEKKLQEDRKDIEECLQVVRWTIKKVSMGLSVSKTKGSEDESSNKKSSDEQTLDSNPSTKKAEEAPNFEELFREGEKLMDNFLIENNVQKAINIFEKLIKYGDVSGKAGMGRIYLEGLLGEPDYKKAFTYINEAVEKQDPYGICLLGEIYANGINCEKDIDKAKELFWRSAMQNCARGQMMLGKLYIEEAKNEEETNYGLVWLDKAGDQDNGEAEFILYQYYKQVSKKNAANHHFERADELGYYETQLCNQDNLLKHRDDLEWLKRTYILISMAAKKGNRNGQYLLGLMYDEGIYLSEDKEKAFQYYEQSAMQGYPYAQHKVGYMYWKGIGVEYNSKRADEWLKKAADIGLVDAQYHYAAFLANTITTFLPDEIIEYGLKAAKSNHVEAMNLVGWYYAKKGKRFGKEKEAFQWIKKAADNGLVVAISNVGRSYLSGIGVDVNLELAEKYLKEAAEKGNLKSFAHLSSIYQTDKYNRKNLTRAYQYLKLAGEEGKEELNHFLQSCASIDDIDYLVFLKKIAEDDPVAYRYIGDMYMNGVATAKSYKDAYTYYRKAQENKVEGLDYQAIFDKIDQFVTFELTYNEATSILQTSGFQKAIDKLIELANKGYDKAQVTMGKLYIDGYRVSKNLDLAKRYLFAAKRQGNTEAEQYLKAIGED